jgi:hypothetical protein
VVEILPTAEHLGHVAAAFLARRSQGLLDFLADGDVDRFAANSAEGVEFCQVNRLRWLADAYVFSGLARFWQGDWDEAADLLRAAATVAVPPIYVGRYSATLLTFLAWAGDGNGFDRLLAELRSTFARMGIEQSLGTVAVTLAEVEGYALLGRYDDAAAMYPVVEAMLDAGVVMRPPDLRIVPALAGVASGLAGDDRAADAHFEEARRLVAKLQPRQAPDVDLLHALAAMGAGGQGESDRARRFIEDAIAGYNGWGMSGHRARAEAALAAI